MDPLENSSGSRIQGIHSYLPDWRGASPLDHGVARITQEFRLASVSHQIAKV
jgi:hypothetical protein